MNTENDNVDLGVLIDKYARDIQKAVLTAQTAPEYHNMDVNQQMKFIHHHICVELCHFGSYMVDRTAGRISKVLKHG